MKTYQFDVNTWLKAITGTALEPFAQSIAEAVNAQEHALKHGHLPVWNAALDQLQQVQISRSQSDNQADTHSCATGFEIVDGIVTIPLCSLDAQTEQALREALQGLMPWRKGPFQIGPVVIDTEWRSDWKWDRLAAHIGALEGKTVLDVGCGSGYHLWRMRHAGASTVLGIDPSLLYVKQFEAIQHFINDPGVQLLPLPMHGLPANMQIFDTVFSMGVLYHRREPMEHLHELKAALRTNGQLVLETLVIPGETDETLSIEGRYANMRNIYELPSTRCLCRWVQEAGFHSISVVDVTQTSRSEQRTTAWMRSHSLAEALDSHDLSKTLEGYPRPLRAVVTASPGARHI